MARSPFGTRSHLSFAASLALCFALVLSGCWQSNTGSAADRITFQCAERFAGDGADDNGRDGRIENRTSWPAQPHEGDGATLFGQRAAR